MLTAESFRWTRGAKIMSTKVGFIGLGAIGRPMAKHIAGRFEAMVWNRTPERAQSLSKETRAWAAQTAGELIGWADVVITCLPTSHEVRQIVEREDNRWRKGQLLID